MNNVYKETAKATLEQREALKQQVLRLVMERCEPHECGRLLPGAIQTYIWHSMGFKQMVDMHFRKFVIKVIASAGYTVRIEDGHHYVNGLKWKGERNANWRSPKAWDIPKWLSPKLKYRYVTSDGTVTINKPMTDSNGTTEIKIQTAEDEAEEEKVYRRSKEIVYKEDDPHFGMAVYKGRYFSSNG